MSSFSHTHTHTHTHTHAHTHTQNCLSPVSFFKKFIYFWLCWVFVAACGLSLAAVSGGYSSLRCADFSLRWLPLLRSTGSRRTGSRVQAQQLWRTRLVAPQHVGSSRTRARTCVPCIGRHILNHCATREAPPVSLMCTLHFSSPSISRAGRCHLCSGYILLQQSRRNYYSLLFVDTASLMLPRLCKYNTHCSRDTLVAVGRSEDTHSLSSFKIPLHCQFPWDAFPDNAS